MRNYSLTLIVLIFVLAACAAPTATEAPTQPPTPSHTAAPTETALPTDTPAPTETPLPTEAPTQAVPANAPIVFTSNRGEDPEVFDLYLLDPETLEVTALPTGQIGAVLSAWSPDHMTVAFAVPDAWNLYTINADGSGLTQVTAFRSNSPDWSPDGTQLVFQSDHQNEPQNVPDLYTIGVDGVGLTEIVDEPDMLDFSPRWSPDGESILFLSNRSGNVEIYLFSLADGEITQVTDGSSPVMQAAWSPDGETIAFIYSVGTAAELYTIARDGELNSVVRLTADNYADTGPAFSPDGSRLVYASTRNGQSDLWAVDAADGGNPTQLTNDMYVDAYPDW